MTEENMTLWNAVKQPPPWALKPIGGGRLKGKTEVNPQWRYQAMTEQFGPCGDKWSYELCKLWTEPAPEGQVFAFAEVRLHIVLNEMSSMQIPGIGGSMLVELEWSKAKDCEVLHANDEAYKMAVTDALSVAMKMLGVASDVYAGLWDGSKYRDAPAGKAPEQEDGQGHWCASHDVAFFKKGNMKGYSHPIEGSNPKRWCNEPAGLEKTVPAQSSSPAGASEKFNLDDLDALDKAGLMEMLKSAMMELRWGNEQYTGVVKEKYADNEFLKLDEYREVVKEICWRANAMLAIENDSQAYQETDIPFE